MTDTPDLTALAAEAAASPVDSPAPTLENIRRLADEVNVTDARIEKGEALLKELKEHRNRILQRDLVDLMDQAGIEDVTVDGRKFTASHHVHASIPEEYRDEAHDWLEENDAGDLINCTVTASFPKECLEEAMALKTYIVQRHQMATVEVKRAVPWARLTSWLKAEFAEARETGRSFSPPLVILGAAIGRIVKIKEPKV